MTWGRRRCRRRPPVLGAIALLAGPLLVAATVARVQDQHGAVDGVGALYRHTLAGLRPEDRAAGGVRELLVRAAVAAPDLHDGPVGGGVARRVQALAHHLLVGAAVAAPDVQLGTVDGAALGRRCTCRS